MPTSSLGGFTFLQFDQPFDRGAPPVLAREETSITQRPGVDGTGIFTRGAKAQPFEMLSVVDTNTFANGVTLQGTYRSAIASGKLTLVWGGVDFDTTFSTKYVALDVRPIRVRRLAASVGGIGGGAVLVEALWLLVPVPS